MTCFVKFAFSLALLWCLTLPSFASLSEEDSPLDQRLLQCKASIQQHFRDKQLSDNPDFDGRLRQYLPFQSLVLPKIRSLKDVFAALRTNHGILQDCTSATAYDSLCSQLIAFRYLQEYLNGMDDLPEDKWWAKGWKEVHSPNGPVYQQSRVQSPIFNSDRSMIVGFCFSTCSSQETYTTHEYTGELFPYWTQEFYTTPYFFTDFLDFEGPVTHVIFESDHLRMPTREELARFNSAPHDDTPMIKLTDLSIPFEPHYNSTN